MDRNTARADDFTVQLSTIPPHENTHDLAKKLKKHFEKVLSETRPVFLPGKVRVADINFTTGSHSYLHAAINRGKAARKLDMILYHKSLKTRQKNDGKSISENLYLKWMMSQEGNVRAQYEKWNKVCLTKSEKVSNKVKRHKILLLMTIRCLEPTLLLRLKKVTIVV